MKKFNSIFVLLTLFAIVTGSQGATSHNVILMISDGQGFNGWQIARNYQGGLPYDNGGFVFYGCTTDMLKSDGSRGGYDPKATWKDFNTARKNATDSAAAASAIYTGQKTTIGTINKDGNGNDLTTIAEYAARNGKATGAISSVLFNHATPGAVDAHNKSRNNYNDIAADMITSDLDVIMGGDAKSPIYAEAVKNGFTVINDKKLSDWDKLAEGSLTATKVFGGFSGDTLNGRAAPTLETMAKGALNVLSQDSDGFFLMVEGGAVDWNNHANNLENMVREQVEFDKAVAAVIAWIEAHGGWKENLLIVTADHETGQIWGADGKFIHCKKRPVGVLPTYASSVPKRDDIDTASVDKADVVYNSGGHTNVLVPLWAKGAGSEKFAALVDGIDHKASTFWNEGYGWKWDGSYIDNTDIFTVICDSMNIKR